MKESKPDSRKARAIGFNHVALEVGDIDEALDFWGGFVDFELRGKSDTMAFIDLGDQFLALQLGRKQAKDDGRHFGLVVSDKETVRASLKQMGDSALTTSKLRISEFTSCQLLGAASKA